MTDEPTPDDIDDLTSAIEALDAPWTVTDWNYQSGKYDPSELQVDLEWSPPDPATLDVGQIQDLKTLIAKIESEHEDGAPINTILHKAHEEFGWKVDRVSEEIDKLRTKGEVYEPRPDSLRTT